MMVGLLGGFCRDLLSPAAENVSAEVATRQTQNRHARTVGPSRTYENALWVVVTLVLPFF
jgi:hypothetical protein